MKSRRKPHFLTVFTALGLVLIFGLLAFSKQSPATVGSQFMSALAEGNVDKLTDLTYMPGSEKNEIREKWEYATKVAGKHYIFNWQIKGDSQSDERTASVRVEVDKNMQGYGDAYGLDIRKDEDGKWKVDVRSISREMYPGLPRG